MLSCSAIALIASKVPDMPDIFEYPFIAYSVAARAFETRLWTFAKVPVLTLDDASEISADLRADEVFTDERVSWACFRSILLEGMAHEASLIESVKRDIRAESELREAEEVAGLVKSVELLAE